MGKRIAPAPPPAPPPPPAAGPIVTPLNTAPVSRKRAMVRQLRDRIAGVETILSDRLGG